MVNDFMFHQSKIERVLLSTSRTMTFKVLSFLIVSCISMPCWTVNSALCGNDQKPPGKAVRLSGSSLQLSCKSNKNIFNQSGPYEPRNVIVTRAQVIRDTAVVALPRYKPGVPFTLGIVNLKEEEDLSKIDPFFCEGSQKEGDCHALQSVVDIFGHTSEVWALDVGIVNTLEQPTRRCSPKIWRMNPERRTVSNIYDFRNLTTAESRLEYLVVVKDVNFLHVYVADAGAHSILVLNIYGSKSHRIVLPKATCPENDVLYIAVTSKKANATLFFTCLRSPRLYSIKTQYLEMNDQNMVDKNIVDVGEKPYGKQMILLGSDFKNSLFFRYKGKNEIYKWDTRKSFESVNFERVHRGGNCRLTTQVLRVDPNSMWALESNFYDFLSESTGCDGASINLHEIVPKIDD